MRLYLLLCSFERRAQYPQYIDLRLVQSLTNEAAAPPINPRAKWCLPVCTRILHSSPNIALRWPAEPSMPLIILLQPKEVEGLQASRLPSAFVFFSAEIYINNSICVKHSLKLGTTHNHTALPNMAMIHPADPYVALRCCTLPYVTLRCPMLPYVALQDSPYSARATE